MSRRMLLLLVTLVVGVGSFTFSSGMRYKEARADLQCSCTVYVCPGYPHLKCLGKLNDFGICDHLNLNCQCDPCP